MRVSPRSKCQSAVLALSLSIAILYGCAPIIPAQPTPLIPQTGPTAPKPTSQVTEIEPTEDPIEFALIPVRFDARVFRNGDTETAVKQDQRVSVEVNDRIEVVKRENQVEQSHSILSFSDFLEIELFTDAILLLEDVEQETDGTISVTLNLSRGHIFVRLREETDLRVTVETPDSTISTLESGTEFNICTTPDKLTCVEVKRGSVDLISQGKNEIIQAQQASLILKDELPSPAICAPAEIFGDWEEKYGQFAEAPPLSAMIAGLQEVCSWQRLELPPNARRLYQDQFTNPSSGWLQEKGENHFIGYSTPEYYHIQVQNAGEHILVSAPGQRNYIDFNIDLAASTLAAKEGDYQYGVAFRRSEDNYYAFAVSPSTKKWSVLKSSPNGLEILKEATNDNIQDLDAENALRIAAKGSLFTFFINGKLVYQLIDFDYPDGEVGLFSRTVDSPSALIYFDSLTIWEITPVLNSTTQAREMCFNEEDDDGDRFVDRDDPDCNTLDILPGTTMPPVLPISTESPPTIPPEREAPTATIEVTFPPEEPPVTEPPVETLPPEEPLPTEPPTLPPEEPLPTEPPTEPPTELPIVP